MSRLRRRRSGYSGYSNRFYILSSSAQAGFSLVELLVVIVIVGILLGIMAPGWLQQRNVQLLNTAQDSVVQAMRQAQSQAVNQRQPWQAGFRQAGNQVEWTVSAANASPTDWQSSPLGVQIVAAETTLGQGNGVYRVVFDHRGHVLPPLGRINLGVRQLDRNRRCVVVSTFLGMVREAADEECVQPD